MDLFILRKDHKSRLEYSRDQMKLLLQILKSQDRLDRVDKLSMMFRMESRSEFQDHNLNNLQHQVKVHSLDSNHLDNSLHP